MNLFLRVSALMAYMSIVFYFYTGITAVDVRTNLMWAGLVSLVGYFVSDQLIPQMMVYLTRRGLSGKDMGRLGRKDADELIPSALGAVVGIIFVICIIVLQVFDAGTMEEVARYNAATMSICFMIFLGFADDVVDLPWRFKLLLPPIASLALLCSYTGQTSIQVPRFLQGLFYDFSSGYETFFAKLCNLFITVDNKSFGSIINLGYLYYMYMLLLAVFCTNAINIYAGVNGLEVGQSVIVGFAILMTNLYQLQYAEDSEHPHVLSAMIIMAFLGVSMALLKYNWFPAQVFVGDTYCYFAGMTFAVVAILGHFSKTLLIYMLPQIFNFLYSCPQLFKIYPCPRHRLPAVRPDGLRAPSTFEHNGRTMNNMTLINLVLAMTGPIREETLTFILLVLQAVVCLAGFAAREFLSDVLYG